ncbi:MAG: phosphoribosylaminoimidazole carboxylase PurE protein [Myxococcota bacterium]|jgi:phosphoribosylaminoimidazole carboxylase PurE protein
MRVGIVMGSKSDLPVVSKVGVVLDELGVEWEMRILSAHRTPAQAEEWARTAQDRGIGVLVCCAGMAAHLGGVVAAHSMLPVIGVPINASLGGIDSLLSIVQMPPGVPVGTVGIGSAGAKNAAWLAARILALSDPALAARLIVARQAMTDKVLADDAELQA